MNIGDIKQYSKNLNRKIFFDYELKKTNWFNIGGKAKIYFKPETLQELIEFLKLYNNRGKIFVIGAGSNILFQDGLFNGVVIKLGKNFSKISILNHSTVVAGSGTSDKQLSEFARSEEHTSELQSRRNLVCRLLLEKKKKKIK